MTLFLGLHLPYKKMFCLKRFLLDIKRPFHVPHPTDIIGMVMSFNLPY
jgi:hypothetical protein